MKNKRKKERERERKKTELVFVFLKFISGNFLQMKKVIVCLVKVFKIKNFILKNDDF